MRPGPRFAPVLLVICVACQDTKVGAYNTPPSVSVLSPADASVVEPNTLVEFFGAAQDGQDAEDQLTISWESSLDGVLGTDPPDGDGNVYLPVSSLSSGDHVITLTAIDTDAESASTSIALLVGPGSVVEGTPPTVVILGPTDGQVFNASDAINLIAAVTDGEDPYETLSVEVIDVPDGSLWTGSPAATGSLTVPLTLTPGQHLVTLNATDSDGNTASETVGFEVLEDGRPVVEITTPTDGSIYDLGTLVSFRGVVTDDETAVDALGISWSSDRDGVLATNPADSSGAASTAYALSAGIHTVTLAATDGTGLTGSDSIVVTVEDPLSRDDDGDGFSESTGDCDDGDPRANPDATDLCDDMDNDCSGEVNDGDWDTYERNQSLSTAYNLGEVDSGFGWTSSSITLSGLTLSDEGDEDWFKWDADDDFLDNVNIVATLSGLPPRGTYVIELYDGDGRLVDSMDGGTALTVRYDGDEFDTDEDDWSIRVYATTWPSASCSSTFTLTIRS